MIIARLYFNSIKVRLEPVILFTDSANVRYFNSIKVRLELFALISYVLGIIDFNSIKVRLEQILNSICSVEFRFQFHKGTIRT